jgi:hypothetical protein
MMNSGQRSERQEEAASYLEGGFNLLYLFRSFLKAGYRD